MIIKKLEDIQNSARLFYWNYNKARIAEKIAFCMPYLKTVDEVKANKEGTKQKVYVIHCAKSDRCTDFMCECCPLSKLDEQIQML